MVSDLGGWAGFGQKPEPEPPARRLRRVDDTAAPADVVDHREALDFPLDGVWPDETVRFIRQVAVSTSTDPAMVATLALPVLGAAIGNSRAIRPKRDWEERARFWTVVIAPPSVGKSPVGRAVKAPLAAIQRDLDALWRSEVEQFEQPEADGGAGGKGKRPTSATLLASNTTIEALADVLAGHPRGVLLYRDELSGWVDSMGQYKTKGDDRQLYLELWGGETIRVNRKGKDPVIVNGPHLSVAGTVQPGRMSALLGVEDGFAQRLLVCAPRPLPADERAPAVDPAAEAAWDQLVRALYRLEAGDDGPLEPEWAPGAQEALIDALQAIRDEEQDPALAPVLAQAWGKMRAYLCRFALLLAAVWAAAEDRPETVTVEMVEAAAALVRYFQGQAIRVYEGDVEPPSGQYSRLGPKDLDALVATVRKRGGQTTLAVVGRSGPRQFRDASTPELAALAKEARARGLLIVETVETPRGPSHLLTMP